MEGVQPHGTMVIRSSSGISRGEIVQFRSPAIALFLSPSRRQPKADHSFREQTVVCKFVTRERMVDVIQRPIHSVVGGIAVAADHFLFQNTYRPFSPHCSNVLYLYTQQE